MERPNFVPPEVGNSRSSFDLDLIGNHVAPPENEEWDFETELTTPESGAIPRMFLLLSLFRLN